MTNVAINPDPSLTYRLTRPLAETYVYTGKKYKNAEYPSLYGNTKEYNAFMRHRAFVTVMLVAAPVAFIWLSLLTLIGYVALGLVPMAISSYTKNISSRYSDQQAYKYYHQLEGDWAGHGHTFYAQVWEHDCAGAQYKRDPYRSTAKNLPTYTECRYCDARIIELQELAASQKENRDRVKIESSEPLFEASREFRKAIAETSEEDKLMKEISASVRP